MYYACPELSPIRLAWKWKCNFVQLVFDIICLANTKMYVKSGFVF